jgi:hypothetical protein
MKKKLEKYSGSRETPYRISPWRPWRFAILSSPAWQSDSKFVTLFPATWPWIWPTL